jgi:hypothetical protein
MIFDTDQMIEALEPPAFKAGGRVYTGVVLSVPEALELQQRIGKLEVSDDTTYPQALAIAEGMVRAMFPRPWWKFWYRPERVFAKLPFPVQLQLIQGFSQSLVRAMPTGSPGTAPRASDSPSATS